MLCVCDTGDGHPCVMCVTLVIDTLVLCVCDTGDGHLCVMCV